MLKYSYVCSMNTKYLKNPFKLLELRFIRYLFVGALNTLFSLCVYWILVFLGVHYSLAVFISNTLGVLFNFKTTGKLVFSNSNNNLIFKFFLVYVVIYLLSVAGIKLLLYIGTDKYSSAVIVALPMAVISFFLHKHFVFKLHEHENR